MGVEEDCGGVRPGHTVSFPFLKSSPEGLLIDFREKQTEGEREGEKHLSLASCTCPDQGPDSQPRHMP